MDHKPKLNAIFSLLEGVHRNVKIQKQKISVFYQVTNLREERTRDATRKQKEPHSSSTLESIEEMPFDVSDDYALGHTI